MSDVQALLWFGGVSVAALASYFAITAWGTRIHRDIRRDLARWDEIADAARSDLALHVWCQFAYPVPTSTAGVALAAHDGGLSVLEDVRDLLVAAGRLRKVREDRDWYVVIPVAEPLKSGGTR